jgi:hypothetical protein
MRGEVSRFVLYIVGKCEMPAIFWPENLKEKGH